jgi:chemotaxis signal transduction protein/DNA-binding XRE family transcriptional regulator
MAASIVREARRRAGISQRELARRAGTSQPAIARIEAGRQSPGHTTLTRLVEACGLELHYELAGAGLPQISDEPPAVGQLLVVDIGGSRFGLPVATVGSVERWAAPRRLPYAPAGVLGVAPVGERLVTVLDPLIRMGLASRGSEPAAIVVLTSADGAYALAVDTVVGLDTPPPGSVHRPPAVLGSPPSVTAMTVLGDQVVTVLDPARLIPVSPST